LARGPSDKKDKEVPHINENSSTLRMFLLYFMEMKTMKRDPLHTIEASS
jgi:hypothetical protein